MPPGCQVGVVSDFGLSLGSPILIVVSVIRRDQCVYYLYYVIQLRNTDNIRTDLYILLKPQSELGYLESISHQGGFHVGYLKGIRRGAPPMVGGLAQFFSILLLFGYFCFSHKRFVIWRNFFKIFNLKFLV